MARALHGQLDRCSLPLSFAVYALTLALVLTWIPNLVAQGLNGPQTLGNVGAAESKKGFQAIYKAAQAVRAVWKQNPRASCFAGGSSVCSPGVNAGGTTYQTLLTATSPIAFDSSKPSDTGGFSCIGPARDQGDCLTCTAMAAMAAAEAAVACVLRIDAVNVRLSEQDFYFCDPRNRLNCGVGWDLISAVNELVTRGSKLVKQSCLPYVSDPNTIFLASAQARLCKYKCDFTDNHASQGSFNFFRIPTAIGGFSVAQLYIRRYGSVITRMSIDLGDFKKFFSKSPNGIYPGTPKGTSDSELVAHAVVCHGYDDAHQYWVCLNSWGQHFAVQGSFKIKYGVCDMMTDTETYGIIWKPTNPASVASMVTPIDGEPGCYSYTAKPGDSTPSIAFQMWGDRENPPERPLQRFLQKNSHVIANLDVSVVGKTLTVCNPLADAITTNRDAPGDLGYSLTDCTASRLAAFAVTFEDGNQVGGTLAVSGIGECCRLCAATSGCQFWSYLFYISGLTCKMYNLNKGHVTMAIENRFRGGILTYGPSAIAVPTDECGGSVYIMRDVDLVNITFVTSPAMEPTKEMRAAGAPKFVSGAKFTSWRDCCQQARKYGLNYWTYGADKRCWFRVSMLRPVEKYQFKHSKGAITGIMGKL